ncbi:uncharacterized protein LOC131303464 isoform X1 [Rhododendron vialii]|uniref:uncharacterized protein LOC131303464 isoform X1 n=1 Tax=Rhododendron vialii TaxID=182163 RepID=UPI002660162E|nr:uncharacterized protein LOC131303464 isoform X1 [Rhododendron vialii]
MDPKKDLAVCGCSTVAWKDRMEEWKKRQNERRQVVKHEGHGGDDSDGLDLPNYCLGPGRTKLCWLGVFWLRGISRQAKQQQKKNLNNQATKRNSHLEPCQSDGQDFGSCNQQPNCNSSKKLAQT